MASQEQINNICHFFRQSLSHEATARKEAEAFLKNASTQPSFSLILLQIIAKFDIEEGIRSAAAIYFKNHIKNYWVDDSLRTISITTQDKDQVKSVIVDLMLNVPRGSIQKQLAASLQLISETDFPNNWKNLLPDLIAKFKSTDLNMINGVLRTIHSILKRYRHATKTDDVLQDLLFILKTISQEYFDLMKSTMTHIEQQLPTGNGQALFVLFTTMKLLCNIYYSLNNVDLPEFFEDNLQEFMTIFQKILQIDVKIKELEGDDDEKAGLIHQTQAIICHILNVYVEKYDEEFQPFLQAFTQLIWSKVTKIPLEPKFDSLATSAIHFLGSIATSTQSKLFESPETLKMLCENIVIPNLRLREIDVEMFEDNPTEYIRRELEGSDTDTRRKAATELVKNLRKYFENQITSICSSYITTMLASYSSNPKDNWLAKDAAIYLITALTVKGAVTLQGATTVNPLVPVMDFFTSQIVPELQAEHKNSSSSQILLADSLRFVATFRRQIPKEMYPNVFTVLVKALLSKSIVVQSYAANAIEKMLLVKDEHTQRFGKADLKPFLQPILENLFKLMDAQSKENEYLMKCLTRVVSTSQGEIAPYSNQITKSLVNILLRICQNPSNPTFNHFLFETIASTITSISSVNPGLIPEYEALLFPPFSSILTADIQEFAPYVFQILSLLLERTPSIVNQSYLQILPPMLSPTLWERSSNIPALRRLIQAYLEKGGSVLGSQHTQSILGVFHKLIASKIHDHEGFALLESILKYSPEADAYLPQIFKLIFTRMQDPKAKTPKFVTGFIVSLSYLMTLKGASYVIEKMDLVQPNIFTMVLASLWIPNAKNIVGRTERNLTAVGTTKLICDCPKLLAAPYDQQWQPLFDLIFDLIESTQSNSPSFDDNEFDADDDEVDHSSYTVFSKLHLATQVKDPLTDINPKQFLAQSIHNLTYQYPGKFLPNISQLSQEKQNFLKQYLTDYKIPEPFVK